MSTEDYEKGLSDEPKGKPETKSVRSASSVDETVDQSDHDAKRSKIINILGYVVLAVLLLYYTVVQWIDYANTSVNRQTTVGFTASTTMTFPAIALEITDYGIMSELKISLYPKICKVTNLTDNKFLNTTYLHNPKSSDIPTKAKNWIIVNTSLAYYGFSGFGFNFTYNDSYSRRLFSAPKATGHPNTTEFSYSYNDYYSSSSSNIYYILPPTEPTAFAIGTNTPKKCGDVFVVSMETTVPMAAFNSSLSNPLLLDLSARAYPDSFGIQIAYDNRANVLNSLGAKDHIYFTDRIAFGETISDELQLIISNDEVDGTYDTLYETLASIDYTNQQYHQIHFYPSEGNVVFDNYLFVFGNNFLTTYTTSQQYSWLDVISNIGGMYATIAGPIAFVITIWLYGVSIGCFNYKGAAPLDPLPDDMEKRLDVYIAQKVKNKQLLPGRKWKGEVPTTPRESEK